MIGVNMAEALAIATPLATLASAVAAILSATVAFSVYHRNRAPEVVAYIEKRGGVLFLVAANVGGSPAYGVAFSLSGDVCGGEAFRQQLDRSFAARGIGVLMPSARRSVAVGTIDSYPDDTGDPPTVEVAFRTGAGRFARKRARTYPLDWQSLVGPMSAKDVRYEMERNVAKAADAIVRRLG